MNENHAPAGAPNGTGGQFVSGDGNSVSTTTESSDVEKKEPEKNSNKYEKKSRRSDQSIIDEINADPEYKEVYDSLSDEDKLNFIEDFRNLLNDDETEVAMTERFPLSNLADFEQFYKETDEAITNAVNATGLFNSNGEPVMRIKSAAFPNGKDYTASDIIRTGKAFAGSAHSFDFGTYCRLGREGYEKSLLSQGKMVQQNILDSFEEKKAVLDVFTNSYKTSKPIAVYRLVNTDYLFAQFGDDLLKATGLHTVPYFAYYKLEGSTKNCLTEDECKAVVDYLNTYQIGSKVDTQHDYASFGMDLTSSHMAKHVEDEKKRQVFITFDCPEGTPMGVTHYYYESEGLMSPKVKYYIKSASYNVRNVDFSSSSSDHYEIPSINIVMGIQN